MTCIAHWIIFIVALCLQNRFCVRLHVQESTYPGASLIQNCSQSYNIVIQCASQQASQQNLYTSDLVLIPSTTRISSRSLLLFIYRTTPMKVRRLEVFIFALSIFFYWLFTYITTLPVTRTTQRMSSKGGGWRQSHLPRNITTVLPGCMRKN